MALTKYEGARDRNLSLDKECEHLINELQSLNGRLSDLSLQNEVLASQNAMLQRKQVELTGVLG
jgi:hypothetical protein